MNVAPLAERIRRMLKELSYSHLEEINNNAWIKAGSIFFKTMTLCMVFTVPNCLYIAFKFQNNTENKVTKQRC